MNNITASSSYMNGLYSLHDPHQQRITQPYQHNLLSHMGSGRDSYAAQYMSPPRQPAAPYQQSYPHHPPPHQHSMPPSEAMLAFQQSRSRSLDASMYYEPKLSTNYNTTGIFFTFEHFKDKNTRTQRKKERK